MTSGVSRRRLPTSSPLQLSCSAAVNVLTLKMPMSSLAYFNYLCFTHVRCSRLLRTATVKLLGKVTLAPIPETMSCAHIAV